MGDAATRMKKIMGKISKLNPEQLRATFDKFLVSQKKSTSTENFDPYTNCDFAKTTRACFDLGLKSTLGSWINFLPNMNTVLLKKYCDNFERADCSIQRVVEAQAAAGMS